MYAFFSCGASRRSAPLYFHIYFLLHLPLWLKFLRVILSPRVNFFLTFCKTVLVDFELTKHGKSMFHKWRYFSDAVLVLSLPVT